LTLWHWCLQSTISNADNPISGECFKVRLLFACRQIPHERRFVDVIDRSDLRQAIAGLNPARAAGARP
jgi:hypothetical protein